MSLRPFVLTSLALALAAGCGPESSSDTASFGLDLLVEKAVSDQLSAFQIVVLQNGQAYDCNEIQKTCLNQQVKQNDLLVLRDTKGTEGRALRFPVALGNSGTTQDVSIEVPVGRDYALVIEAISTDTPPRFLGSSCNYLPEGVSAGRNDPLIAAAMTLAPIDCDPTF